MTAGLETTVADAIRGEEQPVRSAALIALVLLRRGWFVLAATILMTTQPFLTTMSKNSRGGYDYLSISITLIVEIVKGLISLTLYALLPASRKSHRALRRSDVLLFAIPAVVYAANNNLIFAILAYVNATTYQVLSSLKTLFTAVLFRLVLKCAGALTPPRDTPRPHARSSAAHAAWLTRACKSRCLSRGAGVCSRTCRSPRSCCSRAALRSPRPSARAAAPWHAWLPMRAPCPTRPR